MSNELIDPIISVNFLAHALLAGPEPEDRLGALLGDFVKGPLPGGLPPHVASGAQLHRRIDSFADAHPVFRQSRSRVSAERRRYSGIMIDLFYDHFLALHWNNYCGEPLEEFSAKVYALLSMHADLLPPRLAEILPSMRKQDWLGSYRTTRAIGAALDRMAVKRLKRPNTLAGSGVELEKRYREFEQDFLVFFPDAHAFACEFRHSRQCA